MFACSKMNPYRCVSSSASVCEHGGMKVTQDRVRWK